MLHTTFCYVIKSYQLVQDSETIHSSFKHLAGGDPIFDQNLMAADGIPKICPILFGQLPFFFGEPWRK